MARNAHIRPDHIEAIVNVIHAWDRDKLTWADLCAACGPILGYCPSRSGLSSHGQIAKAFQARKAGLRLQPAEKLPMPGSLAAARRQLGSRDAEIAALKRERDELLERFSRWQYNAWLRRITVEMLDEALPAISRKD